MYRFICKTAEVEICGQDAGKVLSDAFSVKVIFVQVLLQIKILAGTSICLADLV